MNKKGKIAAIKSNKVKVFYEETNTMTPYIDVAAHVTNLQINTTVVVALYDGDFRTGCVIGVIS